MILFRLHWTQTEKYDMMIAISKIWRQPRVRAGTESPEGAKMKEYTYQLEKDDYREWIQWNIKKHDQKKLRYITVGVMMALLAMTLIGNLSAGAPLAAAIGSSAMFLGLGAIMLYFISPQSQERMIYKKSGLKKMEKTGFPTVNLILREDGFDLYGSNKAEEQMHYQYTALDEVLELERLILLKTTDGGYQFVAKKAFASQEEQEEFKTFLQEKREDAKAHPEHYSLKNEEDEAAKERNSRVWEEGYVVRNKNTDGLGKIGQMAHILAPSDGEESEESVQPEEPVQPEPSEVQKEE
ncbi:MAG: YcxB family protein [Clostridium sp.]|nr:YcxB family protein [Clostridium sp.]